MLYAVESMGKRKKLHEVMVNAGDLCVVIQPLQSTKEQMHTIRMLHISRRKQLAMDI